MQLRNLDIVRSFAVLLVVARHVLEILHIDNIGPFQVQFMGIYGVMLFFVHTSCVLMMSMERQRDADDGAEHSLRFYSEFLLRRVFRIYPLSMAVVAVLYIASQLTPVPGVNSLAKPELIGNLLLVQNLFSMRNIIGPLWSLPLEVQMYLLLPMIFIVLERWGLRSLLGVLFPAALFLAVISYAIPLPQVIRYAPCFLPGVVAYQLFRSRRAHVPFIALPGALLVTLLGYMALAQHSQTLVAYPVCMAIGCLLPFVRPVRSQRLAACCAQIAKYSYGVYLVHAPLLAMSFRWLKLPTSGALILFSGATAALSVLTFHTIENPCMRFGARMAAHLRTRWRRDEATMVEEVALVGENVRSLRQ